MQTPTLDIRCPKCGSLAAFEEPFTFSGRAPVREDRPIRRWGGWHVVERFPSTLSWRAPSGSHQYLRSGGGSGPGYPLLRRGVVQCKACHVSSVHTLNWPHDAWWQWEIRGQRLWAWNRGHAEFILEYTLAKHRPRRPLSGGLGRIPSHFLSAKVRHQVARKILRSMSEPPNPSIERTCSSGLRPLPHAAHVKR